VEAPPREAEGGVAVPKVKAVKESRRGQQPSPPHERLWDERGTTGLSLVAVEKVKVVEEAAQSAENTVVGEKM
jgi:hypothetical protein